MQEIKLQSGFTIFLFGEVRNLLIRIVSRARKTESSVFLCIKQVVIPHVFFPVAIK